MVRRSFLSRFYKDQGAAIAPLFALGIGVLVTLSAVGFDYGRLMALDTELQNAAGEAALAAATQLDGSDNAMANARNAATSRFASTASTFTNETRFANDTRITGVTDPRPITSLGFRFWDGYNSTTDVAGALLTSDASSKDAQVVEVTVNARRVFYALTPLVNAISSGDVIGRALAGVQASQCNVAPMFFCLPQESGSNVLDFPRSQDIGHELKLHLRNSQSEVFTPGNFEFLDFPYGTNSQQNTRLGLNTAAAGCFAATPDQTTVPGNRPTMGRALNTRLDVFDAPLKSTDCNTNNGDFCPSANATKDWVNVQSKNQNQPATCAATSPNNSTWMRYSDVTAPVLANPGYPDDSAFSGVLGNGSWATTNWMNTNHSGTNFAVIPDVDGNGSISRYEAFLWELGDKANRLKPRAVGQSAVQGNKYNLYCSYPQPVMATAWPASTTQKDRRILTVGAVACNSGYPNGSKPIQVLRWVDLFVVRPMNNASETEFVTEIIGSSKQANGNSGFQYFGRHTPVLIR